MAVPAFPGSDLARHSQGTVQAPGGPDIHWERYTPPEPRSTVLVLHGAGDHLGRYAGITDALVRAGDWDIGVSKTGYISESGKCLVMQAMIANTPVVIVLLDSWGRLTRVGDANRIKRWLEKNPSKLVATTFKSG